MADGADLAQTDAPPGTHRLPAPCVTMFVPSYRGVMPEQTNSTLIEFTLNLAKRGWFGSQIGFGHYDIHKVRNHALSLWYFHYPMSTHLFMVDDDMSANWPLLEDMLRFDKPLVGCLYLKRNSADREWVGRFKPNPVVCHGFMEMDGVGCGFFLIRRDCVDRMIEADPSLIIDDPKDHRLDWQMMDKIKIKKVVAAFDRVETDFGFLSEDYSFCERYRRAGGEVWAAATHPVGHIGVVEWRDAYLKPLKGMTTQKLVEMLTPARLTSVLDIGASALDGPVPYKRLLMEDLCRLTGIDANPDEVKILAEHAKPSERYLCYSVGLAADAVLSVTKAPGMTSLLTPDPDMMELLPGFAEYGEVVAERDVECRWLDDIAAEEDIGPVDYIKIDAQGSELAILQSGNTVLRDAVCVQVEVPFLSLYKDMPTFAEIDAYLRGHGFVFHRFASLKAWPVAAVPNWQREQAKQLLDGDAIYVRDFRKPGNMSPEQWKQLAIIAHAVLDAPDLACGACGCVAPEMAETYAKALEVSQAA